MADVLTLNRFGFQTVELLTPSQAETFGPIIENQIRRLEKFVDGGRAAAAEINGSTKFSASGRRQELVARARRIRKEMAVASSKDLNELRTGLENLAERLPRGKIQVGDLFELKSAIFTHVHAAHLVDLIQRELVTLAKDPSQRIVLKTRLSQAAEQGDGWTLFSYSSLPDWMKSEFGAVDEDALLQAYWKAAKPEAFEDHDNLASVLKTFESNEAVAQRALEKSMGVSQVELEPSKDVIFTS